MSLEPASNSITGGKELRFSKTRFKNPALNLPDSEMADRFNVGELAGRYPAHELKSRIFPLARSRQRTRRAAPALLRRGQVQSFPPRRRARQPGQRPVGHGAQTTSVVDDDVSSRARPSFKRLTSNSARRLTKRAGPSTKSRSILVGTARSSPSSSMASPPPTITKSSLVKSPMQRRRSHRKQTWTSGCGATASAGSFPPASRVPSPVRFQTKLWVEATLYQPACCYLVWRSSHGQAHSLYPWQSLDFSGAVKDRPVSEVLRLPAARRAQNGRPSSLTLRPGSRRSSYWSAHGPCCGGTALLERFAVAPGGWPGVWRGRDYRDLNGVKPTKLQAASPSSVSAPWLVTDALDQFHQDLINRFKNALRARPGPQLCQRGNNAQRKASHEFRPTRP